MSRARFEVTFDHHTVQLAGELRVEVARGQQLGVLHVGAADLVVVRDVDLLLALELPVVAVRRAVEQVSVVGGAQAIG
jgi:hypothetical protein